MALLFFYGTLKRDGANHGVLVDLGARFVADATTAMPRVLVDLGPYPALLASLEGATSRIHGELFEVDDEMLDALDEFEGAPDLYRRERLAFRTADGKNVDAFAYVLALPPPAHARHIADGRYVARGVALPNGATPEQLDE